MNLVDSKHDTLNYATFLPCTRMISNNSLIFRRKLGKVSTFESLTNLSIIDIGFKLKSMIYIALKLTHICSNKLMKEYFKACTGLVSKKLGCAELKLCHLPAC